MYRYNYREYNERLKRVNLFYDVMIKGEISDAQQYNHPESRVRTPFQIKVSLYIRWHGRKKRGITYDICHLFVQAFDKSRLQHHQRSQRMSFKWQNGRDWKMATWQAARNKMATQTAIGYNIYYRPKTETMTFWTERWQHSVINWKMATERYKLKDGNRAL